MKQAELTLDDDDHEICAAAQTSKKTRYHSPRKQSNGTDITSDFSAFSFKDRNVMLGSSDSPDDDSEAPAPAPARVRAAGKGRNVMLDSSDEEESDDGSEARAAGNLKIGDESDSDASSSVSNFQFSTGKNFKWSGEYIYSQLYCDYT